MTAESAKQLAAEAERYEQLKQETDEKIARYEQLQTAAVTADEIIGKANEQAKSITDEATAVLEDAKNSVEPVKEKCIHQAKVEADGILLEARQKAKDIVEEAKRQAEAIHMQTRSETEQLGHECGKYGGKYP